MENRNWKDKIIIAFIIYVFSPLIIVALIVFGVPLIFENPKNRKEYKNSFYYKKTGVKYKRKIIYSPEYRFYNNAVKRKLPIEYIKQKSNGFEYFIYDGKIYMFPDFEQIEFNKEKNAFLVDYDGEWKSFDKAYEKMLSYLDNKNFEAKILVERKMFNEFKLSENDIPENVFVTREYETVFENEDFPLKLNIP
ncbi:MAG: hypothetical protein J6V36_05070 [Clostridia bacterium]|nr:hypothetical protein [Clostridia bacterium]